MGKFFTFYPRSTFMWTGLILIGSMVAPSGLALAKSPATPAPSKKVEIKKIIKSIFKHGKHGHHRHGRHPSHMPTPIPPVGSCSVPFNEKVHAARISNSHIYINMNDLNFIKSEYGFLLQDVELEITYKNKNKIIQTMNLALNGIKASQPGGFNSPGNLSHLFKSNGETCSKFKLHNLLANGIEPFDRYLLRLKKNKGLLRISVLGHHAKIVDAYVTFKGVSYTSCNPVPTTTTTSTTTTTTVTLPPTTTTTLPGSTTTTTSSTTTTLPPVPTTTTTLPPVTTTTTTTMTTTTTTLPPEDLSKYEVQIDSVSPDSTPTASTNMLITFSSEYTDGTYWCSLDQAAFEKCQSPAAFAGLANGQHTFQVYAQTPREAVNTQPVSFSWEVDSVQPVVQITNLTDLPSLTNQVSVTFQFASTKSGTFKCSLDGATAVACASPMTYTVMTEGLHTFSVTAIDKVGNVSGTAAQFQWTIDLTPPTANIVSIEPNETLSKNPSRTLAFAADETSNFECSIDQGGFAACESPVSLQNLGEGSHWFEVRAVDLAGNVGSSVTASWNQDYTAPEVALGAVNPSAGLTNVAQASVEFFMNEPGTTHCQWDSEPAVNCSSPFQAPFLSDGAHQLSIYGIDSVGNQGAAVTVNWMVDATAPLISIGEILPSGATYQKTGNISVQVIFSESTSLSASLNGTPLASFTNPIELSGLSDGSYTLSVSGFDSAGNLSNTIEHSFIVDTQAPFISLTGNGGNLVNVDSRSVEISSDENATFECSLDEAGFAHCQSPSNSAGLADGDHTLIVRATDLAGNQSQASHSWSVDTVAPSTLEAHNQVGSSITFSLGSSEIPVTYICSMDGEAFTSCSSPVSYTGLAAGSHNFVAKAVDTAGNTDPSGAVYGFTVYPPIQTNITFSNPAGSIVKVKTMSISFSANQPTSGYICSLDGAAFASCSSPVSYSGLAEGNHSFVVKAIDQFGVTDATGASKSWTIDSVAPAITSFTTTTTTNSITVTWFLNEPGTGKVNYGVGTALNQATVETSTTGTTYSIKLTGLSSNTMYSIQVSGKDAAGNVYTGNVQTARTNR